LKTPRPETSGDGLGGTISVSANTTITLSGSAIADAYNNGTAGSINFISTTELLVNGAGFTATANATALVFLAELDILISNRIQPISAYGSDNSER